jgi:hypothetical protein
MKFSEIQEKLAQPFDEVKFRAGATRDARGGGKECKPLGYIDAADVIDRLNEHCPDEWSEEYELTRPGVIMCKLTICGITRCGVGQAGKKDEEPEKSAESDALKRAAVKFGIGTYLRRWDLPYHPMVRKSDNDYYFDSYAYVPPADIPLKGRRTRYKRNAGKAEESTETLIQPRIERKDGPKVEPAGPSTEKLATEAQIKRIKDELEKRAVAAGQLETYLERCNVTRVEDLPFKHASSLIDKLKVLPLKQASPKA